MSDAHAQVKFGTDGIRGEAGQWPCTVEVARRIGQAAARLAGGAGARVLIVTDTRPSGPAFEAALADGVRASGAQARLGGVLPTSALATALAAGLGEAGVMVTASHNPAQDNGFKLFSAGGHKLSAAEQRAVEGWLAEDAPPARPGPAPAEAHPEARQTWLRALWRAVGPLDALRGRHLVLDLAHGAASAVAAELVAALPCQTTVIGGGDGVINDRVGSQHPEALAAAVRALGADAGLAVDGDADRCLLVDERGEVVPGDTLAWWLAAAGGVRGLAVTVMSTTALEAALPAVRVVRTPVGDQHLAAAMAEHGLPLGVEESGHALFSDALPAGDGLVTGLRALRHAFAAAPAVSVAFAPFVPFPRAVRKVRCGATRPPVEALPRTQAVLADCAASLGENGRTLLRYSGTEPILRILVEGPDAGGVAAAADALALAAEADLR